MVIVTITKMPKKKKNIKSKNNYDKMLHTSQDNSLYLCICHKLSITISTLPFSVIIHICQMTLFIFFKILFILIDIDSGYIAFIRCTDDDWICDLKS